LKKKGTSYKEGEARLKRVQTQRMNAQEYVNKGLKPAQTRLRKTKLKKTPTEKTRKEKIKPEKSKSKTKQHRKKG